MTTSCNEIVVVIRCAGERTEEACQRLVREQVEAGLVATVSERPFARALEKSIEIALECGSRWSLFLDADVLLRREAIPMMMAELEACSQRFYMMNFLVMDRGFCGPAYDGVHAFRTELFSQAVGFMPLAWSDQRPETRLCKEMGQRGYPTILSKTLVGLHDYEQYYRDLYRKMFVRALKYKDRIDYMASVFRAHYRQDDDYKAMLWGLVDGLIHRNAGHTYAVLDVEFYRERSAAALEMIGLTEKDPLLALPDLSPDGVIQNFQPDALYLANRDWIAPEQRETFQPSPLTLRKRLRSWVQALMRS